MPYEWQDTAPDDSGAVSYLLILWPHRSLPPKGFVWFIGVTAGLMALPLSAVLGSVVLWGLLPFILLTLWGVWTAIKYSYRSGQTWERLQLSQHRLELHRHDFRQDDRIWRTNPYWVRPQIRKGPVKDYLTLTDGQREIELGRFLTPEERRALCDQLATRLATIR